MQEEQPVADTPGLLQNIIFTRKAGRQLTSKMADPNNLKSRLLNLKIISSYYEKILKDHSLSIEDDVTTSSFLKINF
jgi:hypothetical protein